jgi:hypothetical protein
MIASGVERNKLWPALYDARVDETRRSWLINLLFAAVVLLRLLPVWRVDYVPAVDGASHVYNARSS